MRILLIEDDPLLGDGIRVGLRQVGHTVDWIQDGLIAAQALLSDNFDVVVLDIGLPGKNGLSLLTELRQRDDATPVLLLTARDSTQDKVVGLDTGADDYLVKPFDLNELAARIRAIARRRGRRASPILRYGELSLDPASRSISLAGKNVEVTPREFAILETLLEHQGQAMSRAKLEEALYGWDEGAESNTIEVHIHHLRRKLGKNLIHTVRGVGYMIKE